MVKDCCDDCDAEGMVRGECRAEGYEELANAVSYRVLAPS